MTGQRTPERRAVEGINSEPAQMDNIAEAIDQVLREVQAARRDIGVTSFCLQQAEALRRIDRAKASIAVWCIPGAAKTHTRKQKADDLVAPTREGEMRRAITSMGFPLSSAIRIFDASSNKTQCQLNCGQVPAHLVSASHGRGA
jgi:hypothetical protein